MNSEYTKATHLIVDFFGCKNLEATPEQLKSIILTTGCNLVKNAADIFFMIKEMVFIQLEEGYMTLTINEKYNYVAIDFYAYGEKTNPKLALPLLTRLFRPTQESTRLLRRGIIS